MKVQISQRGKEYLETAQTLLRAAQTMTDAAIAGQLKAVCTENLDPGIVVMESAEDGRRFDAPGRLNRARDWCIFVQ